MKDLPIWARWNGQHLLSMERGEDGWHTYYLRRNRHGAPALRATDLLRTGLGYLGARLASWCGKPWRRLVALRAHRA